MPFVLDLVRHGEALPAGPEGDAARELSTAGALAIERLAARLANDGWRPTIVLSSPLLRARQTTAILLGAMNAAPEPRFIEELFPDVEPEDAATAIAEACAGHGHVVVIAHQPLLGRLAGLLMDDVERGFSTGMLVRLEINGSMVRGAGALKGELRG